MAPFSLPIAAERGIAEEDNAASGSNLTPAIAQARVFYTYLALLRHRAFFQGTESVLPELEVGDFLTLARPLMRIEILSNKVPKNMA